MKNVQGFSPFSFLIPYTYRYVSYISIYIFLSYFFFKDSIENEYLVSVLDSDTPRARGLEKSGSWDSNFISKSSEERMNFGINFLVPQILDVETLFFFPFFFHLGNG